MTISERVTRGLSLWLTTAVAATTIGWTAAGRAGSLCSPQEHPCTPTASLACCCHSSPGPSDTARLSEVARPSGAPSHRSLMDVGLPIVDVSFSTIARSHPPPRADLGLLYRTLLI
jgi:hypothetical protein